MSYINTANARPENDPSLMTLQQKGIAALTEAGYEAGEYNPHNVRAWASKRR